uniref:Uncharacterized protein n=1 Tax=Meloidogyne enterolobii TaxID=390850 RepID=A0A6V7TT63_MELEN|nr:unnamed protein product [Meloidogyne enterolobii]
MDKNGKAKKTKVQKFGKSPGMKKLLNQTKKFHAGVKQLMDFSPEKIDRKKIKTDCTSNLNYRGKLQQIKINNNKKCISKK